MTVKRADDERACGQVHLERSVSPRAIADCIPESITIVIDGRAHEVAYREDDSVLVAARRAGLDPPFSCEEGYCSSCMAKLAAGDVKMAVNDCLTPDLLAEGWVLTCQSRCQSRVVRIEYPD